MPYISSIGRIERQEGLQEGIQQGQHEKAKNLIQSLLKSRFGVLDEELSSIIEPLTQMPDDEVASLYSLKKDKTLSFISLSFP